MGTRLRSTFEKWSVYAGRVRHKPGPPVSLFDVVQGIQHQPDLGKGPHEVPEPRPPEAVLGNEAELGVHAPGILKPDLVIGTPGISVVEEGRLGSLVVLDGYAVLNGQLNGPLVGDGLGPGLPG